MLPHLVPLVSSNEVHSNIVLDTMGNLILYDNPPNLALLLLQYAHQRMDTSKSYFDNVVHIVYWLMKDGGWIRENFWEAGRESFLANPRLLSSASI